MLRVSSRDVFLFTYEPCWCLVLKSSYLCLEENDCIAVGGLFTPDIRIPHISVSSAVWVWAHFSFFLAALPTASGSESGDVCRSGHDAIPAVNIAVDWSDQCLFLLSQGQRVTCPEWDPADPADEDMSGVCIPFFYLLSSSPGSHATERAVLGWSFQPGSHRSKLRLEVISFSWGHFIDAVLIVLSLRNIWASL